MSLSLHIQRRNGGVYYFRKRIPQGIVPFYDGRKEICFSLRTREPSEAKRLSYQYSLKYSDEFERYSHQISSNSSEYSHGQEGRGEKGFEVGKSFKKPTLNISMGFEKSESQAAQLPVTPPKFSEVWEAYAKESGLKESSRLDNETHIRRFIEIAGNKPVAEYSRFDIKRYKDILLKTPTHMNAEQRKAGIIQTIKTLEKAKIEYRKLAPHNVKNRCLSVVRCVFSHAVANAFITANPTDGITVAYKKKNIPVRFPFTDKDLETIFKSPLFTSNIPSFSPERLQDYQWIILLALYTGARLEEIGRLAVDDISKEEGIDYMFIREDADTGRSVKNACSIRKVPIHSKLIELGVLNFVEQRQEEAHTTLFPSLFETKVIRGKCTHNFSKWFGRYLDKIGLVEKGKTFHSFRHTFKRTLRNAGVDMVLADALQGHTEGDASSYYGRDELGMGFSLPVLKTAIENAHFIQLPTMPKLFKV